MKMIRKISPVLRKNEVKHNGVEAVFCKYAKSCRVIGIERGNYAEMPRFLLLLIMNARGEPKPSTQALAVEG